MSTENDPEIQVNWTHHDTNSWEYRVEVKGVGHIICDVARDRSGDLKAYRRDFVVNERFQGSGYGKRIMTEALAVAKSCGITHVVGEADSPKTVGILRGIIGDPAVVVRDFDRESEGFNTAMTPEQAVEYLAAATTQDPDKEGYRSLVLDVDVSGLNIKDREAAPERGRPVEFPQIGTREKEQEQVRERADGPGQTGIARDIDPNKGQSRDPDDNPGTGGTPAPSPEPPTPELPTGSSAANPEAGRSLEALQKGVQIAQEIEPHQRVPEGDNPSGKEQSRDPQQKTGPERGVEPEPGGKPGNGSAQLQSAVQQKVQEITPGRELDGIGEAAEQQARAKSHEAAIAAAIERARETAKSTRKPSLGERITKKVREVVPGRAPQHEREPVNGPGLLPSKITPEMQREADLGKALQSRGVDPAAIWAYRDRGWSLTETLAAVKAVEREERGGTLPAQGKSRETGMQPQGVARDPHMDALAAVVKAHTVTRTPRVEQPTQAQELARQKEEDNNRQSLKFISEQLAMGRKLEQDRAQQRTLAIAQIRKETPSLTLEQASLELVRRENERQANAPGRTKRSGPELGPRGIERGR